MLTKLFLSLMIVSSPMMAIESKLPMYEKMYLNEDELESSQDGFHIHTGDNLWITTDTVTRDETGLYTYEFNLKTRSDDASKEIEKKWKCPYCFNWWPEGKACANAKCPSKYK